MFVAETFCCFELLRHTKPYGPIIRPLEYLNLVYKFAEMLGFEVALEPLHLLTNKWAQLHFLYSACMRCVSVKKCRQFQGIGEAVDFCFRHMVHTVDKKPQNIPGLHLPLWVILVRKG